MTRENYSTVEKFLKKNPEFIIEKIDSKLPHEDINGTNLFLPDISCGVGFYVAKLKRES
jgi:16S rRNA C967 or C1407 C5-methylase (RsmB/RsmF family)